MWINVPEGATNDYVAAMAAIFKNGGTVAGVTYPGLDSNLKVDLEYSNEVWGGIPYNEYYQEAAVQNTSTNLPLSTFPGNLDVYNNVDGTTTTNVNTAAGRRYLEETADIGQIFQGVLGADPTHQRIRPVLGWQENNSSFWAPALQWFEHFFGSAGAAFYGMGDANYFGPTTYSSENAVIASLQAQEASYSIPDTTNLSTLATYFGLANVSYEGGPSIGGDGTTAGDANALAASRDPRMESIVEQHYLDFYAAGGTLAMYFNGPWTIWSPSNEWSAAELSQYGNPTASPKYRGTVDVAAAAPVAPTAGVSVPSAASIAASGPASFSASTDSLGDNFNVPNTGQQGYWLLNAASGGTYDLKLSTGPVGGQAPGQVEVFVDDKQIGGPINVLASSMVDLGNLPLTAGLNTLSIYVLHGGYDPSQGNAGYYQFQPTTFTLTTPGTVPIGDPGFEAASAGGGGYAYSPTGSAWTFAGVPGNGSGVTGNGSAFTSGNPSAPQGSQVAFLQGAGAISQSMAGWAAGSYTLSFDAARRGNYGGVEDFEVLVDGNVVGTFKPTSTSYQALTTGSFTVPAGANTVEFLGSTPPAATTPTSSTPSPPASSPHRPCRRWATRGSRPWPPAPATTSSTRMVRPGRSSATRASPATIRPTPRATPRRRRGRRSRSSRTSPPSRSRCPAGPPAPTSSRSMPPSAAITSPRCRTSRCWSTATWWARSSPPRRRTRPSPRAASPSRRARTRSSSSPWTAPAATTRRSSTPSPSPSPPPPLPTVPTVGDPGFEVASAVGAGGLPTARPDRHGPSPGCGNGSGVTGNGSGFTSGNPSAPQGSQVAFLQGKGSITQSVAGWAAGSYTLSFDAARRGNYGGVEDFEVLVDGNVVGTFKPTSTSYQALTTGSFTVPAGANTVEFLGLNTAGGDDTDFLDAVSVAVASAAPPMPTVGDSGFEAVSVGAGNYAYSPTGSAWTFTSTPNVGGAGVAGNGSAFTSGNPAAPQGSQVAFLQAAGSITQTVANWAAGSYDITLDAAQRGNYGGVQDFEVLVDGNVVGTFKPTTTSYQLYTTSTFTVSAGSHTIQLLGINTAGGDDTDFLDNVAIA